MVNCSIDILKSLERGKYESEMGICEIITLLIETVIININKIENRKVKINKYKL